MNVQVTCFLANERKFFLDLHFKFLFSFLDYSLAAATIHATELGSSYDTSFERVKNLTRLKKAYFYYMHSVKSQLLSKNTSELIFSILDLFNKKLPVFKAGSLVLKL